jgi:hypothetical protein
LASREEVSRLSRIRDTGPPPRRSSGQLVELVPSTRNRIDRRPHRPMLDPTGQPRGFNDQPYEARRMTAVGKQGRSVTSVTDTGYRPATSSQQSRLHRGRTPEPFARERTQHAIHSARANRDYSGTTPGQATRAGPWFLREPCHEQRRFNHAA